MPVSHFPPTLMSILQSFNDPGEQRWLGRIGDVPNFVGTAAEDPQHIGLARIPLGQCLTVADAHHLRAALFVMALQAGNVREVFGLCRIGYIDDRGAIVFGLAGEPIDGLRHVGRSAVVPDVSDIAAALMVDGRLIGAARMQIAVAHEPHVLGFRRIADLGRLSERRRREDHQCGGCNPCRSARPTDGDTSLHHALLVAVGSQDTGQDAPFRPALAASRAPASSPAPP
jgi:hypothetical protein